jgi:succinoglycan biosynthesis transport protein ExoP
VAIGRELRPESFARAGARTLLVDFDLRTPAVHAFLKIANEAGVCEALRREAEVDAYIQPTPNGLFLLPAGKWTEAVRHHVLPDRIGELFDRLRGRFDCVIVNTHPVLEVAETAMAARLADAVLLSVEKHESRLPMIARAQDKIAAAAPESFGVVFLGASSEECLN